MTATQIEAWTPTYRELLDRAKAEQPKVCPNCSDDSDITPLFVGEEWQCGRCDFVWEAR